MTSHTQAIVSVDHGLEGDRYQARSRKRQVTLLQAEHLPAIASYLHREAITPELLRRNLLVSGINLLALKNRRFTVGTAQLEGSGLCHPCSRMETVLGPGGYNAMRGHGGITARVISGAQIHLNDPVFAASSSTANPSTDYQPIGCEDFDHLEIACMDSYLLDVVLDDTTLQGKALTTQTTATGEFLHLRTATNVVEEIRADRIRKIIVRSQPRRFAERTFLAD